MLDLRSPLILAAAPVGLLLAAVGWLATGGGGHVIAPIEREETRLAAVPRSGQTRSPSDIVALTLAATQSLFVKPAEVSVRLDGVARSPGRAAALLTLNGGPSRWITVGATAGGVTLLQIGSSRAVVDTGEGPQEVVLGQTVGSAGQGAPGVVINDQAPPGRGGLEPASAPGT